MEPSAKEALRTLKFEVPPESHPDTTETIIRNELLLRETAKLFGLLFVGRRDAKAVFTGSQWLAVREKFTLEDFRQHLFGERCLGAYLLDAESNVRMMAFDIDLMKNGPFLPIADHPEAFGETDLEPQQGNLEAALHRPDDPANRWAASLVMSTVHFLRDEIYNALGLTCTPIITGGGAHVLVPFGDPIPATDARAMAHQVMTGIPIFERKNENFYTNSVANPSLEIEIFPKQDALKDPDSLGNLIRLPFGWHHEAGIRTYALDPRLPKLPSWELKRTSSMDALRLQAAMLDLEWQVTE